VVERRPEKAGVASSILAPGTSFVFRESDLQEFRARPSGKFGSIQSTQARSIKGDVKKNTSPSTGGSGEILPDIQPVCLE
jgi:hypothetical protein